MSKRRPRYVWAAVNMPHLGVMKGDHLLVTENREGAHYYYTIIDPYIVDEGVHEWILHMDQIHESRIEGWLARRGPERLAFTVAACGVLYMIYHVILWAT